MKKSIVLGLTFLFIVAMAGCFPSQPHWETYYTPAPIPDGIKKAPSNWKSIVINQTRNTFKDPASVKYEFISTIRPCTVAGQGVRINGVERPRSVDAGQCGGVMINAKNSYGAYVGRQPYVFVLDGQNIIFFQSISGIPVTINPPIDW
jgi:hypothetical protein